MNVQIKSYEEFLNEHEKYDGGGKCFVSWCNKPAYYKVGDIRFYCGMCEEHAGLKESYRIYLKNIERKIQTRMLWNKDDTTLESLYKVVTNKLMEIGEV